MPVNHSEQAFFNQLAEEARNNPPKPLSAMSVEEVRASAKPFQLFADEAADIPFADQQLRCQAGHSLHIRVYKMDQTTRPLIIFFPGNGFMHDLFESNHVALSKIAKESGCHAVLVAFRLAPEHPFPAAVEDAIEAVQSIIARAADFNADLEKVIVGGLSSGANLAAVVCNEARKWPYIHIFHQLLIGGSYDLTRSLHSHEDYEKKDFLCNAEAIDYFLKQYCPQPRQRKQPHCSPYWEKDLSGLPPTTIKVNS